MTHKPRIKILFADDEWKENHWDLVFAENLGPEGIDVEYENRSDKVLDRFRQDACLQLLLLDLSFKGQGLQGAGLLQQMRENFPYVPVIILSSADSISAALDFVKNKGAYYYFPKDPLDCAQIAVQIRNAVVHFHDKNKVQILESEVRNYLAQHKIVGESPAVKILYELIDSVAMTPDTTVLITGETGTGKELVARAIHEKSRRKNRPLVTINCGAIPADLMENELFGHERGAYTGAEKTQPGKFELANGGTLFLDEIAELELPLQAKLLRAIQEREIQRLGSERTIKVDVRILAATNRDLAKEAESGTFRKDLFYRLNVMHIPVPALRERTEDVPLLVEHVVRNLNHKMGRKIEALTAEAMARLMAYDWPGNIRELENCLERAFALTMRKDTAALDETLFAYLTPAREDGAVSGDEREAYYRKIEANQACLDDIPQAVQSEVVKKVLGMTHGNGRKAARILKIDYDNLRKRLQKWQIKTLDYR